MCAGYAVGPGDLVLCVNAAPNHVTGEEAPLVVGETYTVGEVREVACPCGRSDALLDIGVDFTWGQIRFRFLRKPQVRGHDQIASRLRAEKETVR
jgi:hypothetical protein